MIEDSAPLTLADVGTSAGAALGVPGMADRLGLGKARHVIVCLIDGLGWQALQESATLAPHLFALSGRSILAAFPTTTPVGLASLGTGLLAGGHGMVGASFELPDLGEVLTPLHWGHHPLPIAVQPEPTVFELADRAGVRVTTLSPSAYASSGLTGAVLRGAEYIGVADVDDRAVALARILASSDPSFTYVYWPELDRVGHEYGPSSVQWRQALVRVDALVERLLATLVPGSVLVITSDHGMVECPPELRIRLEDDARLSQGVRRWAGEPRARHVYVQPGAAGDVCSTWRSILDGRVDVMTREEVIDSDLMGPVDDALKERIGDLVALPRGRAMLSSTVDATVSGLLGQHGGLTPEEMLIPALVHGA